MDCGGNGIVEPRKILVLDDGTVYVLPITPPFKLNYIVPDEYPDRNMSWEEICNRAKEKEEEVLAQNVLKLLKNNERILAIRFIRDNIEGISLKDAKTKMEGIESRYSRQA